ncbi:MAG: hypothetical protein K2H79_00970 [Bacteroidaceae bacterium]|nr:hypothetical protein [Bacteroidaceae bacterium]
MKIIKTLFICLFSVMLFSCRGEKEGSMGKVDKDKEWFVSKGDSVFLYSVLSDNYYVIDGHKIALEYCYGGVIGKDFHHTAFCFGDLTACHSDEDKIVPSTDWKKVKCDVVWNDGSTCVFLMDSNGEIVYGGNELEKDEKGNFIVSLTNEFQKKLNKQKKFTITVPVTNGKSYEYKFDVSKLGNIDVD